MSSDKKIDIYFKNHMKIHTYYHKYFNIFLPAGKNNDCHWKSITRKHVTPEPNPGPQQKLKASYC